jgi:putative ABC transport system permease protein
MLTIALKMLFNDKAKYFGIILGVSLASMVITWQGSIFIGIMTRTVAMVNDMAVADIWVMDPKVQYTEDIKPLQDTELNRVRGVPGVQWAMPLFKGTVRVRLADGTFQNCNLLGLDDATLTGGPPAMVEGRMEDLRRADAVVLDAVGARARLARRNPDGSILRPVQIGDELEINDRRGVIVGFGRNSRAWNNLPTIYTTYSRAVLFAPSERKQLTFVLAKAEPGQDLQELCDRITRDTGLAAYTASQFRWLTVGYFLKYTGIPINFGIAVGLGFLIGTLITGFMFFSFTIDNLRYFGTFKAMGVSDGTLLRMVMLQALVIAVIGFGLGAGMAMLMGSGAANTQLAFKTTWQLLFVSGAAVVIISMLAAMLSIWKVMRLEPAVVFKG